MVRLVRNMDTGQKYAMKIVKHKKAGATAERFADMSANYFNAFKDLQHPNLVGLIEISTNSQYIKKNGRG